MPYRFSWVIGLAAFGLGLVLFLGTTPARATGAIIVTTTADELNSDGDCALREAVAAANTDTAVDACAAGNGPDTIHLPAGIYTVTLTGSNENGNVTGDLDVTSEVSFIGAGAEVTILDGNGAATTDRLMHLLNGARVLASGLQIRNGRPANSGGGILTEAGTILTVTNSLVTQNTALGDAYTSGGGIASNGWLFVLSSQITSNTTSGRGGGLWSSQTLNVLSSTLAYNVAGGGGGVFVAVGTANIRQSSIVSNTAVAAWFSFGGGGGIYNQALTSLYADVIGHNTVTVTDTTGGGIYNSGLVYVNWTFITENYAYHGGGIGSFYNAQIMVSNSTISANSANSGGGIYHSTYVLDNPSVIENSTLRGNTADLGGGVYLGNWGALWLVNATVSGNLATSDGGGIYNAGVPNLFLHSATIAANTADSDGDGTGNGGGLYSYLNVYGRTEGENVLLANNVDGSPVTKQPDCYGRFVSTGYNLVEDTTGCALSGEQADNIYGQDPQLGSLQDNGGPTLTQALLSASPAIDRGNPDGCTEYAAVRLLLDQRGYWRHADGDNNGSTLCDIGAYEFGASLPSYIYLPHILK